MNKLQCERFLASMDLTEPLTAQLVTNYTDERLDAARLDDRHLILVNSPLAQLDGFCRPRFDPAAPPP